MEVNTIFLVLGKLLFIFFTFFIVFFAVFLIIFLIFLQGFLYRLIFGIGDLRTWLKKNIVAESSLKLVNPVFWGILFRFLLKRFH